MSFTGEWRRNIVRKLIARDGDGCLYCGGPLDPEPSDGRLTPTTRTVDHLVPQSLGGTHKKKNLVLACNSCNQAKADMLPLQFLATRSTRP